MVGDSNSLLFRDEVYRIQGAVFEVYREMGMGFLEAVYQECLALEFASRGVPFVTTPQLKLSYRGAELRQRYVPDFVCYDSIVVELKAVKELVGQHREQVINYLKATRLRLGLLVNFPPHGKAQVERIVV